MRPSSLHPLASTDQSPAFAQFASSRTNRRNRCLGALLALSLLYLPKAAQADVLWWDTNGATAGIGGSGTWDLTTANWNSSAAGTNAPQTWTNTGDTAAIFDGTPGTVTVSTPFNAILVGSLHFETGGPFTLSEGGTLTLASSLGSADILANPGIVATINSVLTGFSDVHVDGGGTIVLGGSGANTYTGSTLMRSGLLELNKSAAAFDGAIPGDLQIGDGTGATKAAEVRLLASDQIANTSNVTILSDGLLNLTNTQSDRVKSLSINGGLVTLGGNNHFYITSTLSMTGGVIDGTASGSILQPEGDIVVQASGATSVISGSDSNLQLSNTTHINVGIGMTLGILDISMRITSGAVIKDGSGILRLSATSANTYSGGTFVNDGLVELNVTALNGAIPGNLTIGDGVGIASSASVDLESSQQIADDSVVTINADGALHFSPSASTEEIGSLAGAPGSTVDLGTGQLVTGGNNTDATFSGLISGIGGNLAKIGTGSWTLTNNNTYTGGTLISAGTLHTTAPTALGTGQVVLMPLARLQVSGSLNVGNNFNWLGGTIQLAPAAGDVLHVATTLHNGGAGGQYLIDATGLQATTYTLTDFATTDFTQPELSATFFNLGAEVTLQSQFILTSNAVELQILSAAASGPILENSAPVNTPTFADFTVNGKVTTGQPTENNQVHSLIFTPNSSLQIFNTLTVIQPVTLVSASSIQLGALGGPNGFLNTPTLTLVPGSSLSGNGGIIGNLVNGGFLSPGNSPGQIHVSGNYTQTPAGTLRIEVAGRNLAQHDLLSVDGKAGLDGTLQIVPLDGFKLKRNQPVTFLTARGGVTGEFATVENGFGRDTILKPTIIYHASSVTVEALQGSFAALPHLTLNQKSVARALDGAAQDPRADAILEYLDYRQLNKLPGDLDKLAPEELTSVFTLGVSLANVQSGNIQRRNDDIRNGSAGFSAAGLAVNGTGPSYSGNFRTGAAGPNGSGLRDDGKDVKATQDVVAPAENRWGAFLSGTGEWVSVGNTDNARGYDLTSGGFTLGLDYKVTQNFAVGLAAGYTGSSADLVDRGRAYVNGGKIGLYATFFDYQRVTEPGSTSKDTKEVQAPVAYNRAQGLYADVAVFGGYNSYDFRRSALQGEARGDTDGGELNVLFGAGYDFKAGDLTFGPTASFNYTYLGTSNFTEHGSLAPLNVHGGKGESLRTALGLKAGYDWKCGSVLIKPEIRAAWQHECGDAAYALDSDFTNGAGSSFRVNGPQLGRDSALLGAGFAIQFNERFSTYFYYDGELGRKNYQATNVTGGIRLAF